MTFKESISSCLRKKYFFRFAGRASRSEFWYFMLFILIVNVLSGILFSLMPPKVAASCTLVVSLLLLPANLGVTVRRLHDRNLSGWLLLIPIGMLALTLWIGDQGSVVVNSLCLAMTLGYLAILCMPGQPTVNRFGSPPVEMPQKL